MTIEELEEKKRDLQKKRQKLLIDNDYVRTDLVAAKEAAILHEIERISAKIEELSK